MTGSSSRGRRREPVFADDWDPVPDPPRVRALLPAAVPAAPARAAIPAPALVPATAPATAPAIPAAPSAPAAVAGSRRYVATPPATAAALRALGGLVRGRMREWFGDARPIGAGEAMRLLLIHHGHTTAEADGLTQARLAALRVALPAWNATTRRRTP